MFTLLTILAFLGVVAVPALADTPFYGPEVPCFQWMSNGNFLVANCPAPSLTDMTVLDLNHCYAYRDGNIIAEDNGNFNTDGKCHFDDIIWGQTSMSVNCPSNVEGQANKTFEVSLAHVENRDGLLACGSVTSCYIDGPGCLGCGDTWIKDGLRCK